jgi:mannose-6-phosphate isomerase-like protein (cupin superfamily)
MKRVKKPWGWELWFAHTRHYVGKVIFIRRGHRLSRQYHRRKHETVFAHQGTWVLELGRRKIRMTQGRAQLIRPRQIHRFCAPYEDVHLLEVSTPHVKDVVRLEDDYGRTSATSATTAKTATTGVTRQAVR